MFKIESVLCLAEILHRLVYFRQITNKIIKNAENKTECQRNCKNVFVCFGQERVVIVILTESAQKLSRTLVEQAANNISPLKSKILDLNMYIDARELGVTYSFIFALRPSHYSIVLINYKMNCGFGF